MPLVDPTCYRHIVKSLLYHGVTSPDIYFYAYSYLVCFGPHSTPLVTCFMSYVILVGLSILSCTSSQVLYSDVIWASDSFDHQSLSAYYVFLGGSLIAWTTKKQTKISHSSTKTELRYGSYDGKDDLVMLVACRF